MNDWGSMTRKFLLGEGHRSPSVRSYIQSLTETLRALSPKTQTERRRIEIARALCAKPNFILLDEPFAGVDPMQVNEIKDLIDVVLSELEDTKYLNDKFYSNSKAKNL